MSYARIARGLKLKNASEWEEILSCVEHDNSGKLMPWSVLTFSDKYAARYIKKTEIFKTFITNCAYRMPTPSCLCKHKCQGNHF
jgi:hypothetical protein